MARRTSGLYGAEEKLEAVCALAGVFVLELHIVPDTGGGEARASIEELRIA